MITVSLGKCSFVIIQNSEVVSIIVFNPWEERDKSLPLGLPGPFGLDAGDAEYFEWRDKSGAEVDGSVIQVSDRPI